MAERLGFDSVHELVDTLDDKTLANWQAVAIIDGWGSENEQTARICAAVHNAVMIAAAKQGAKVDEKDFKDPDDFVPKFKFETKKATVVQTPEQMIAAAKAYAGIR